MTDAAIREKIEALANAVARLQQRVEDLEDLRDLESAVAENAGKPLNSWEQVKSELDLEFAAESERDVAEGKTTRVREPEGS